MMREPSVPKESLEAVVTPINRATDVRPSRYQNAHFDWLQQNQHGTGMSEQNRQYDRQVPSRSDVTSDGVYKGNKEISNFETNSGNIESFKRPTYVQPIYMQRTRSFQEYRGNLQNTKDTIDCDTRTSHLKGNQGNQRYIDRQGANAGYYGGQIGDVEV